MLSFLGGGEAILEGLAVKKNYIRPTVECSRELKKPCF